jgi:cold shock CspA family protein
LYPHEYRAANANMAKADVMVEQEIVASGVRRNGHISVYFETRAFGFVNEVVDGVVLSLFFHLKDVKYGVPKTGEPCSFLPIVGEKGLKAKDVIVGGAA